MQEQYRLLKLYKVQSLNESLIRAFIKSNEKRPAVEAFDILGLRSPQRTVLPEAVAHQKLSSL